jgi:hypothetical protein
METFPTTKLFHPICQFPIIFFQLHSVSNSWCRLKKKGHFHMGKHKTLLLSVVFIYELLEEMSENVKSRDIILGT